MLELKILTGQRAPSKPPTYEINGFEIAFDEMAGSLVPGGTLELKGSPQSFPHSLALLGPNEGYWDIERIDATYYSGTDDHYTIRLGAVTLDGESKLNLKYDRQPELLDV